MTKFGNTRTLLAGFLLFIAFPSFLVTSCKGKSADLVRVGNRSLTEKDLELLTRVNPRLKPRLATPAGRKQILENYVEQELLYQESLRRNLQRSNGVKEKLELYKKIIIAQALLDDELDKKVKEYYQNHQDEFERVKVSHIMIRTAPSDEKGKKDKAKPAVHSEAEALKMVEGIRDRLAKGEEFGKVAKEVSEDERTKNNEGDLGFITLRDKRLERWGWLPLAEKAFALKAGEYSDAIKTKEGFHVVKVTEEKKVQPLEEAETGIRFRLQADIRTGLLEDLKKKYKVEYAKADAKEPGAASSAQPETAPAPASPGPKPEDQPGEIPTAPPPTGNP